MLIPTFGFKNKKSAKIQRFWYARNLWKKCCWRRTMTLTITMTILLLKFRKYASDCLRKFCLWTEEIPPVPIVTGGMVHRIRGQKGEKEGRRRWVLVSRHFFSRRPSFSPSLSRQCTPFRRERSERAESPTENHENTPTAATKRACKT